MYTTVKMDMAHMPLKILEEMFGGRGIEHFDLVVDDYIEDHIGGARNFPPTQFYFEPRKERVTLLAIRDLPQELPAGDVIKKACMDYIRKNLDYVEKVTILNSSLVANDPPEDIVEQSGGMPSRMPDEYTQDSIVRVSQLRDDTQSSVELMVLDAKQGKYVPFDYDNKELREGEVTHNRFENLFDVGGAEETDVETLKKEVGQLKLTMKQKEKLDMNALGGNIDRLVIAIFNLKYNNEHFNPKKHENRD